MNRRSFFRSLSAAVVGCYLGVGVELKSLVKSDLEVKPEWITADYKVYFLYGKSAFKALCVGPPPTTEQPLLFNREDYL